MTPVWSRNTSSAHRAVLRINTLTIMKSSVTMAIRSVQMLKDRKVTNLTLSYTKNLLHNSFSIIKKIWSRIKPHNFEEGMTAKQFPAPTLKKQEINWCTFSEAHPPHAFWYSDSFYFIDILHSSTETRLLLCELPSLRKKKKFQIISKILNSIY